MPTQRCCPPVAVDPTDRSTGLGLFKALADPHRLAILASLARARDEACVCDFTSGLPLNQPTVSHHLRILREAGLVTCERRGTWVYYRLASDARARLDEAMDIVMPEGAILEAVPA
jgi:ArsR family transcriptional regulator, arsenate/arsenite/antimonite-responsive transcriptional repressor